MSREDCDISNPHCFQVVSVLKIVPVLTGPHSDMISAFGGLSNRKPAVTVAQ